MDPARDVSLLTNSLLERMRAGDSAAETELFGHLGEQLRLIAHRHMLGQKPGHTLQTTALVHEAWLKLCGAKGRAFDDRVHFLRVAARAMRNVLIDHARAKATQRRGGLRRVDLDPADAGVSIDNVQFLAAMEDAMTRLQAIDPQMGKVAELRCFAGATHEEIAAVLGVSARTVERSWRGARAWLQKELDGSA